jgi:hypothetical protein
VRRLDAALSSLRASSLPDWDDIIDPPEFVEQAILGRRVVLEIG